MKTRWICIIVAGFMLATASPAHAQAKRPIVVALGDSVASGAGLPLGSHPSSIETKCDRSPAGYPAKVARAHHARLINVSCSGAGLVKGLLFAQKFDNGSKVLSQLSQAKPHEGHIAALTMTAGANSLGWVHWFELCATTDCDTFANHVAFDAALTVVSGELGTVMVRVARLHAKRMLVTGYYNVFGGPQGCIRRAGFTRSEVRWMHDRLAAFNRVIKVETSAVPRAHYVPINFGRHGLCAAHSYVQSSGSALLHPNRAGQRVIAKAITRRWRP